MESRILYALRHFLYKLTGGGGIMCGVAWGEKNVSSEIEKPFEVTTAVVKASVRLLNYL